MNCNFLQDGADDIQNAEDMGSPGVVYINMASAVLFVVVASCFLILLYKLMSYWFIELLVVLFCIGGAEVWHKGLNYQTSINIIMFLFCKS